MFVRNSEQQTPNCGTANLGERHMPLVTSQMSNFGSVLVNNGTAALKPSDMNHCSPSCSRYVERLPLMFIFGIATSPSTIQHMLPHSVSSLLCIELFQSLTCTQHLATVIDKVATQPKHILSVTNPRNFTKVSQLFASSVSPVQLILTTHFPFKLNKKVMQVLMSIFLYHDFSVRNFIKGIQVGK